MNNLLFSSLIYVCFSFLIFLFIIYFFMIGGVLGCEYPSDRLFNVFANLRGLATRPFSYFKGECHFNLYFIIRHRAVFRLSKNL